MPKDFYESAFAASFAAFLAFFLACFSFSVSSDFYWR